MDFLVIDGQVNACTRGVELLGERKAERLLADKDYNSQAILDLIQTMGSAAGVPSIPNRKPHWTHDKDLYRKQNRIERCFSSPKHFRRLATRYEKLKQNFNALVALAVPAYTSSNMPILPRQRVCGERTRLLGEDLWIKEGAFPARL